MTASTMEAVPKGTLINFNILPEEMLSKTQQAINAERAVMDAVAKVEVPTFDSVILPLVNIQSENETTYNTNIILHELSTDSAIRNAGEKCQKLQEEFEIECSMREDVYKVVRQVYSNKAEMEKLVEEDTRLVEKMELEYRRNGLLLPKDKREELSKIKKRLVDLQLDFTRNCRDDEGKESFTRKDLDGLPDRFLEDLETEVVEGTPRYFVNTSYIHYFTVMKHAKKESTRKAMLVLFTTRCPENLQILQEIVELRAKQAKLLGYSTHSEYILEMQMAKTPQAVLDMENDLRNRLTAQGKKELNELVNLKKRDLRKRCIKYEGFFAWDRVYYNRMVIEKRHNISEEVLQQYFPLNTVVRGVLNIYEEMLGLRIVKTECTNIWHEEVELFEVWEAHEKDKFVGHFYLDLHPREGKENGASATRVRSGYEKPDGSRQFPVAIMSASFPKPTSKTPALLKQTNVISFMHEMGHIFHNLCAVTKRSRFHGSKVERDFVEAPSQMLENWAWEPAALRKFSGHYKTGEPIPDSLIKSLIAAKLEGSATVNLGNVFYGMYDMAIHSTTDGKVDINALYRTMFEDITLSDLGDTNTFSVATFDHLVEGYDSKYYGYLYSQVFSEDMFATRFKKEGLDNPKTGRDYRNEILRPGASRDAMVSLEKFLGRKPNNDAFLKSIGL
ncbi:metalloendopeptidase [Coemansia guatemalensis]|uniref:Metalloendopeptidase n=1 Tax=Coemansia guatemalensis TaxID=2761395 RepID=A0A9W8I1A8_9FUNG|nr:metalloendopeptidase [Coemansia guatemalensis]